MRHFTFLSLSSFILSSILVGCALKKVNSSSSPIVHSKWDALLQKNVDNKGTVDYGAFVQDSLAFRDYLNQLSSHHPNDSWTSAERKAYWINAYNAFTVQLIVDNYPVESIKDLGGAIYKVNTPWDIRFIEIEGQDYDLNNIEHDILREEWQDGRIHFAINCASISCPKLYNRAFEAATLDEQLTTVAKEFINGPKNSIDEGEASISRIFKWFNGDFIRDGSLIDFLNAYSEIHINDEAEITYQEYNWSLNGK
ncbi:MAG: DUF547 domain-containing protein [Flavobacteriales bacterium]|nr:DUF547 domain-containing protein [Flavobacteriales bacterium]